MQLETVLPGKKLTHSGLFCLTWHCFWKGKAGPHDVSEQLSSWQASSPSRATRRTGTEKSQHWHRMASRPACFFTMLGS